MVAEASRKEPRTAAKSYAGEALRLAEQPGLRKILIVVNRVDLAREILGELQRESNPVLLMGRVREVATGREVSYIEEKGQTCGRGEHRRNHTIAEQRPASGKPLTFSSRGS